MTNDQADWLYELAHRDGDEDDLRERFPEVDWDAVVQRRQDRLMMEAAARALDPKPRITLDQINEATARAFGPGLKDLFTSSPLLEKLKP